MGSFGKNRIFRLSPVGDFHGQRRGDRLATPRPLYAFHGISAISPSITFRASISKRGSPRRGLSLPSILILPKTPVSKVAQYSQLFSSNRIASSGKLCAKDNRRARA